MALLPPYSIGLATVANGGTSVSIPTAILSDSNARELDTFVDVATGKSAFIRAVPDATHVTIDAWPGTSLAAAAYRIEKTSPLRYVGGRAMADVQKFVDYLNTLTIIIPVVGAAPDNSIGEDGWYALKSNGGGWRLWLKAAGLWVEQGAPAGLVYRGSWSGATAYVVNDRVSLGGVSYTAKQPSTNINPAADTGFVYWDAGGSNGAKGEPGTNGSNGSKWTASNASIPSGGSPGDFYFNFDTDDIFQNIAGTWTLIANIKGLPGTAMRGGSGAPAGGLGQNGDRYFRTDTSDVYVKAAGAWSVESNIKGASAVISGTSTSVVTVGLGAKAFTTQSNISWTLGQRLRATNAAGDRVVAGNLASYTSGVATITVDSTLGAGSDNSWTLSITGEQGLQGGTGPIGLTGPTGPAPVISAASSSVITVGAGAKTFTVPAGLSVVPLQRLRAVNAGGDRVMTGLVSSYSGTTLTINVDNFQGVGTDSTWTISLAGEKGDLGGTGPGGSTGGIGPIGPAGPASTAVGPKGEKGDTGTGLQPDVTGTLAQRSTYDGQAQGYRYLRTDVSPFLLYVKLSNTSADWSSPTPIGGSVPVGDFGLVTDSTTLTFDLGLAA